MYKCMHCNHEQDTTTFGQCEECSYEDLVEKDKYDVLADYLKMDRDDLTIWSDGSVTKKEDTNIEYGISTYKRKSQDPAAKVGKYYIYRGFM